MFEFIIALEYVILGSIGGLGHYLKKRYVDETTKVSLYCYLATNRVATKQALWAIAGSSIGLSLLHVSNEYWLSLSELVGVLSAGYTADSALNRASEAAIDDK